MQRFRQQIVSERSKISRRRVQLNASISSKKYPLSCIPLDIFASVLQWLTTYDWIAIRAADTAMRHFMIHYLSSNYCRHIIFQCLPDRDVAPHLMHTIFDDSGRWFDLPQKQCYTNHRPIMTLIAKYCRVLQSVRVLQHHGEPYLRVPDDVDYASICPLLRIIIQQNRLTIRKVDGWGIIKAGHGDFDIMKTCSKLQEWQVDFDLT